MVLAVVLATFVSSAVGIHRTATYTSLYQSTLNFGLVRECMRLDPGPYVYVAFRIRACSMRCAVGGGSIVSSLNGDDTAHHI